MGTNSLAVTKQKQNKNPVGKNKNKPEKGRVSKVKFYCHLELTCGRQEEIYLG